LTVQDIQAALARQRGNKTRTAADLGIALNTLKARMKALGMS
jgi:DNA-binding NtrC family response regulator